MRSMKIFLVFLILVILAFGVGYGLGYMKLKNAEKEWAVAKGGMQSKINNLEKDLARAKARESLREMSETIFQVITHFSEKNFGLAGKTVDGLKETFSAIQTNLDEEWKAKFNFFLPALEEIKKEAENLSQNARKKAEDLKNHFEQSLKPSKKGVEEKKG
ncbi:MAG: hypothetical protein QME78_01115 [Thermodesulfobacteriota bacterium]|nr:hypothetical protein [Thermodesulfobacteriota bacterium]